MEDFPFPANSSPDEIYEKIESRLKEIGSKSRMTIWAYVDEKNETWGWGGGDFLYKKSWASRIYFIPGGKFFYITPPNILVLLYTYIVLSRIYISQFY